MSTYFIPAGVALFIWWFSTGLILVLDRLPRRTHVWSQLVATALTLVALGFVIQTKDQTSAPAAYIAFACGIVIWGWHELAFLLGLVTGPRRIACPPDATTKERFKLAVQALAYHETAIIMTMILIGMVTWEAPNQVTFWTFTVLFGMRLSTKLNIFLGVPHLNTEMLPNQLDFLKSYFSKRPMNGLFPLSVTVSTLLGAYVFHVALIGGATPYETASFMMLGTLILLGTLEHWMLVLRLPDSTLWRWAMRKQNDDEDKAIATAAVTPINENQPATNRKSKERSA